MLVSDKSGQIGKKFVPHSDCLYLLLFKSYKHQNILLSSFSSPLGDGATVIYDSVCLGKSSRSGPMVIASILKWQYANQHMKTYKRYV